MTCGYNSGNVNTCKKYLSRSRENVVSLLQLSCCEGNISAFSLVNRICVYWPKLPAAAGHTTTHASVILLAVVVPGACCQSSGVVLSCYLSALYNIINENVRVIF